MTWMLALDTCEEIQSFLNIKVKIGFEQRVVLFNTRAINYPALGRDHHHSDVVLNLREPALSLLASSCWVDKHIIKHISHWNLWSQAAWVAQRFSAAFSAGHDLGDQGLSPIVGSLPASPSACVSDFLSVSLSLSLCHLWINKILKKKRVKKNKVIS